MYISHLADVVDGYAVDCIELTSQDLGSRIQIFSSNVEGGKFFVRMRPRHIIPVNNGIFSDCEMS